MMADPTKRRTMIKDRVGCVKTSTYNLPTSEHVYGKRSNPDLESAGDVLSNWVTAKSTQISKEPETSYVHSNIVALKHGCITAKATREFAATHKVIRVKETMVDDTSNRRVKMLEGPFGVKTRFAEEPISDVLHAIYTDFSHEDADYPDLHRHAKRGSLPPPRPTKSSELLSQSKRIYTTGYSDSNKELFKLSRFQNIESKIDAQGLKSRGNNAVTSNQDEEEEQG